MQDIVLSFVDFSFFSTPFIMFASFFSFFPYRTVTTITNFFFNQRLMGFGIQKRWDSCTRRFKLSCVVHSWGCEKEFFVCLLFVGRLAHLDLHHYFHVCTFLCRHHIICCMHLNFITLLRLCLREWEILGIEKLVLYRWRNRKQGFPKELLG